MLKPQPPAKPSMELLAQAPTMDNSKLQKLVKNFVVEDKARLAAAKNKNMPSSIQYALQKFEKNSNQSETNFKKSSSKPNNYPTAAIATVAPTIPNSNCVSVQVRVSFFFHFKLSFNLYATADVVALYLFRASV